MYENRCDKISESFGSPIETRFSSARIKTEGCLPVKHPSLLSAIRRHLPHFVRFRLLIGDHPCA